MDELLMGIGEQLQTIFDPRALGEQIAALLGDALVALLVFAAFLLVWKVVQWLIRPALRRTRLDETAMAFLETIVKYTILAIGVINAAAAIGINTGSVLASLGIAGLTIGFAARDAFSNLISGLLIYLDRPFVIGDLVEIGGNYGRVEQITLRSTRIVTVDGKMLAVPNSDIINKTVASYTNFPHLRLDIEVTVGVEEDIDNARRILLGLVGSDEHYLQDPPARVVVTQLNDYNVALELQAWLQEERTHIERRFELREKVFQALTEAGVDLPFETIRLTPLRVQARLNGAA